ncbi:hypothetical protein B0H11DRAFT_1941439 [Mycena galericulata]|nr:hypothetical protein B0H11DRAFT_1941439 [Mycena galericulata]
MYRGPEIHFFWNPNLSDITPDESQRATRTGGEGLYWIWPNGGDSALSLIGINSKYEELRRMNYWERKGNLARFTIAVIASGILWALATGALTSTDRERNAGGLFFAGVGLALDVAIDLFKIRRPDASQLQAVARFVFFRQAAAILRTISHERTDLQALPVPARFQHVFRRVYRRSTYSNACVRWAKASQDLKDQGLQVGSTPQGLWTVWQKAIPLRKSRKSVSSAQDDEENGEEEDDEADDSE